MKDDVKDGVVNVGEVHCSVCGALQGTFSGGSEGVMKCIRCGRELRFKVQDEVIVLSCKRKKG